MNSGSTSPSPLQTQLSPNLVKSPSSSLSFGNGSGIVTGTNTNMTGTSALSSQLSPNLVTTSSNRGAF